MILFTKQYGGTVLIVTERNIVLVRDEKVENGSWIVCSTIVPDTFDFSSVKDDISRGESGIGGV